MITVDGLADQTLDIRLDWQPFLSSALGIPGRDHLLPAFSREAESELTSRLDEVLRSCDTLTSARLSLSDELTCAVIRHVATTLIDHFATRYLDYEINDSLFAPVASVLAAMATVPLDNQDQANGYLARLRGMPEFLAMLSRRNREGVAAGRTPVARLVCAALDNLDKHLANLDALRRSSARVGRGFAEQCARFVDTALAPALITYRGFLSTVMLPQGRSDDHVGLCWLPDGEQSYAAEIRRHTTTERTAEELHRVGCDMIAGLAEEYRILGARAFGTRDVSVIFDRLRKDPSLRWNRASDMLAAARQTVRRAEEAATEWFRIVPSMPCEVREQPATDSSWLPPYYRVGTLDGSQPGTYFVNTKQPTETARYIGESLTFHEAVPGHHFEHAKRMLCTGVPRLRSIVPINAFLEGWGLYAERLADEMGLYSSDLDRLGMLASDSRRAARLVVDTGLNAQGWTRSQAVDYLRTNTAMIQHEIDSEVDRYLAAPGQALSYMTGRIQIQSLRAQAERVLGARFDIRDFHEVVLSHGRLPMNALAHLIHDWLGKSGRR